MSFVNEIVERLHTDDLIPAVEKLFPVSQVDDLEKFEPVLGMGRSHDMAQTLMDHVRRAAANPRGGRLMTGDLNGFDFLDWRFSFHKWILSVKAHRAAGSFQVKLEQHKKRPDTSPKIMGNHPR